MKYKTVEKLYVCCGQYIAPLDSVKDKKIYCPRCGKIQSKTISLPRVVIVKN